MDIGAILHKKRRCPRGSRRDRRKGKKSGFHCRAVSRSGKLKRAKR